MSDDGGIYTLSNSGALSAKHERIAQVLYDYDPHLSLRYIPCAEQDAFTKPFALFHTDPDYLILTCNEEDVDHRLVALMFKANLANGDPLSELEADEAARQAVKLSAELEVTEMHNEFAASVISSNKSVYRHDGVEYR